MRVLNTCALLGLVLLAVFDSSECIQMSVRPDKGSTVTLSSQLPLDQCLVCTVSGVNDTHTCHSSLSLVPEEEVKLLLDCPQPVEQAYNVTISRTIECTKNACSPATVETQPSILSELTRTFTWELKAPEKTVVSLDILGDGLMEASQLCPDGFQYSVTTSQTNGRSQTEYCRGGSVTRLDLPSEAVVSLRVKPKAEVESVLFQASAGPLKGRTMVLSVGPNTTVTLSRDPNEAECDVCSVNGSSPNCSPTEKTLTNVEALEFGCLKPQDVYSVKMNKKIACTQSSCTPAAGDVEPNLFRDFKRSITWDISVPERTVLSLDFPGDGLKEMSGAESCQNGFQYSVITTRSDGTIKTKNYCKGGAVSHLELLGATTVAAEAPKDGELDLSAFTVKVAPRGGRMMSVMPDPNTTVIIRKMSDEPECSVCEKKEPSSICNPRKLTLSVPRTTSVEFTCPQPEDVFSVEINREIDCTETSCSGDIVQAESSLFPDFNRTFTWDLKVVSTRAFQLDFPEAGMRQIPKEETCPDGHTYSLVTYFRGTATIGVFCKGGTVTNILARYKGRMSLQVPGDRKLDPVNFKLKVGPETKILAIVKVNLPRGVSDTNFITPNYPDDFPDKQQMQWNFTVPGMHNYTMRFSDHTAPECLSENVEVEYQKEGEKVTKLTLTDPQPKHQQGNFNMVLKNCETNRTLQGLTLNYRVSLMRSGHPVLCTVDLTKHKGVSLQIEKVGSDPYCEMSIDSKVEEKIHVASGTKAGLSFLDCPNEDVRLTATKVIGCQNMASCSSTLLTVPKLDSCLQMPLHSFTWHITPPEDGTVDLVSPTGSLRQSLPGQECNQSLSLHVLEGHRFPVGDFCFDGAIPKVQVHSNVSITATVPDFSKTSGPFLNVSYSEEIQETIIYNINPTTSSPTLLATPNWPGGMRPSATLSWIVNVPSGYKAHLQFVNVSQPKCKDKHTSIRVKKLGEEEEMFSRREDKQSEDKLLVDQSFYLNMSNCIPEEGDFGAVTKIVLEKSSNLLAILLGIAGALLLLLTVLAVVCFITKKRKKDKMKKEASIYMGKGNIFRPGDRHFSKSRSDNESHVYTSIDETVVYGHLLADSTYSDSIQDHYKGMQQDSYQTFTGPTDGELPVINEPDSEPEMDHFNTFLNPSETFIPSRPRTPIERQDSLGFQDRRMMDNELYTFKSTGDMNTIQLSAAHMNPQPTITEDSL
ncbi:CUB domain-containing protein 1 [Labrus bergylta]|uniref:CUB domain-containing protein 1 n=1 Tax=Labrus bergylta TaxID=56723 RepID=UPI0010FBAA5C|nr:CUB domain-containing protein 1-like [Labrus bergylta]